MGRILVVGTSHSVAPAELRDGLHLDRETTARLLVALAQEPCIDEAAILNTCTRLEVYALATDEEAAEAAILDAVCGGDPARRERISDHSYGLTDDAAVRHLLRVAAGLDSIVLGEPQILGQVRQAAALAVDADTSGPILRRLFAAGVRAGKRTRAETRLARGPTSLAAAGVRLALRASDDFPAQRVLIIGAGETASLAARHVAKRGPARLTVLNRTPDGARRLAGEIGCRWASLDDLDRQLEEATVVIAATSAPEPLLPAERLARRLARGKPRLVVVDLGRPRNVERPPAPLPGLSLHDLDGLAETVERNRRRQEREIPRVEAIVDEEVDRFLAWRRGRQSLPHVRALRRRFFETGQREVRSHAASFDDPEALEAYTRSLIAKLLHEPTVRIKGTDRSSPEGEARLDALTRLFDLDL